MTEILITGNACIAELFSQTLGEMTHEECWLLTLTKDHRVISEHFLGSGGEAEVHISVREVMRLSILDRAAAFALVHNHPSNNPRPSEKDVAATLRLFWCAKIMGIRLLDHVIVTLDAGHFSFDHSGKLKEFECSNPSSAISSTMESTSPATPSWIDI